MRLAGIYRTVWELLFRTGQLFTTAQLAQRADVTTEYMTQVVCTMRRRRLIADREPAPGTRARRYTVDGLCLAPSGATLAELQADNLQERAG